LWFVNHLKSWFHRGVDFAHGIDTGVFAFGNEKGSMLLWASFRATYYELIEF